MITITQEARDFLRAVECPEGKVLRLEEAWSASGKRVVRFRVGDPEDGDEVFRQGDETFLHVARSVGESFDGFVVQRVETPEGTGVVLKPPDAGEFSW